MGVNDVANLGDQVVRGGLAEADGDDGLLRTAPEPDQPDVTGTPAPAAGAAVVDFDDEGLPAGRVGLAVSLGAAGRTAVEPRSADRVAHDRPRAAGSGAAAGARSFVRQRNRADGHDRWPDLPVAVGRWVAR